MADAIISGRLLVRGKAPRDGEIKIETGLSSAILKVSGTEPGRRRGVTIWLAYEDAIKLCAMIAASLTAPA
jgi:hypothetical protein